MKLASLLTTCGNGGLRLYRGFRDGSRVEEYQWWAVSRSYAEQYGADIVEAELCDESLVLDLRKALNSDGDYDGQLIEDMCPGLADAMGIEVDTIIERDRLWDCSTDEHRAAVECVRCAGFNGWRWFEGDEETFCLFV